MSHQLASWDAPISWNVQFSVSLECRNLNESTIPMKMWKIATLIMEPYGFKCHEYNENLSVDNMANDD